MNTDLLQLWGEFEDLEKNIFYVYFYYETKDSCLPIYVGKGFGSRDSYHLLPCVLRERRTPFYNKLNQLIRDGFQPHYCRIIENIPESESLRLEQTYIKKFGRRDLGTGCLYNITDGGEGQRGIIRRQETRNKISESKMGHIVSQETRDKISESKTGCINNNKISVTAKFLNGEFFARYDFINDVARDGFNPGHVSEVLSGKRKKHKGLLWSKTLN